MSVAVLHRGLRRLAIAAWLLAAMCAKGTSTINNAGLVNTVLMSAPTMPPTALEMPKVQRT